MGLTLLRAFNLHVECSFFVPWSLGPAKSCEPWPSHALGLDTPFSKHCDDYGWRCHDTCYRKRQQYDADDIQVLTSFRCISVSMGAARPTSRSAMQCSLHVLGDEGQALGGQCEVDDAFCVLDWLDVISFNRCDDALLRYTLALELVELLRIGAVAAEEYVGYFHCFLHGVYLPFFVLFPENYNIFAQ